MNTLKLDVRKISECMSMSNTEVLAEIVERELWAVKSLEAGDITQETAWDIFFCLLHECDTRNLMEDRERIVARIDTKKYKPFESQDPAIRFLAVLRVRMHMLPQRTLH